MLFTYSNNTKEFTWDNEYNMNQSNHYQKERHKKFIDKNGFLKPNYADQITQELVDDVYRHSNHIEPPIYANIKIDYVYSKDIEEYIVENLQKILDGTIGAKDIHIFLTDNRLLLGYFAFTHGFIEDLYKDEFCIFSLDNLLTYRCIKEKDMEEYNQITNASDVKDIALKVAKKEKEISEKNPLSQYKSDEKKKLKGFFKVFTELDITESENNLSPLDYCFFNYLLEMFDSQNAKNFRLKKYDLVESYYYNILYCGVIMFLTHHYENPDIDHVKKVFSDMEGYSINLFLETTSNITKYLKLLNNDMKNNGSYKSNKIDKLRNKAEDIEKELAKIVKNKDL